MIHQLKDHKINEYNHKCQYISFCTVINHGMGQISDGGQMSIVFELFLDNGFLISVINIILIFVELLHNICTIFTLQCFK